MKRLLVLPSKREMQALDDFQGEQSRAMIIQAHVGP